MASLLIDRSTMEAGNTQTKQTQMVIGTDSRQADSYALPKVSENSESNVSLISEFVCQQRYDQNKRKPVVRQPLHRRSSQNGLWLPNPKPSSTRKSVYEEPEEYSSANSV